MVWVCIRAGFLIMLFRRLLISPYPPALFLFQDYFPGNQSPPLAGGRVTDPGNNTVNITDANNKSSIVNGEFVIDGTISGGITYEQTIDTYAFDTIGRSWAIHFNVTNLAPSGLALTGFGAFSAPFCNFRQNYFSFTFPGGTAQDPFTGFTTDEYVFGCITRGDGATDFASHMIARVSGVWKLLWATSVSAVSSSRYPDTGKYMRLGVSFGVNSHESDYFALFDMPENTFTSLYGIATQRLAGIQSAGTTFTHTADCLLHTTIDTLPATSIKVNFREQDTNNTWQMEVNSGGDLILNEGIAGSFLQRGISVGRIANGDRAYVVARDETIQLHEGSNSGANIRVNYGSATNYKTETSGRYLADGGGQVSEIISWPYDLSAYTGILDNYFVLE